MTITELAGSFGIKSCPTQQLETAPLTLQLQINTISRDNNWPPSKRPIMGSIVSLPFY
jgi:hypothetical protein